MSGAAPGALRALQVTSHDAIGRRFNNLDLAPRLAEAGVDSRMLAYVRDETTRPDTRPAYPLGKPMRLATRLLREVDDRLAQHARAPVQSFLLGLHPWFREADVVHHHLIHDGWFSLDALPRLVAAKPTVWTWHDPWPMTGHCIYPGPCGRWREGCGACPDLARPFPMRRDRTAEQHAWKRRLFDKLDLDVVVASRWMEAMARASPLARGLRLHRIPFGVNLEALRPGPSRAARFRLGVPADALVVGYRHHPGNPHKGTEAAVAALRALPALAAERLHVVATHGRGAVELLGADITVTELGWVDGERATLDSYRACDVFLMPSRDEAFGMMAMEAMACGKPVVVMDGTSLPEVTDAPRVGVSVPQGDVAALAAAMARLLLDPAEREARGRAGRQLALERYGDRRFAADLAALYREAVERRRGGARAA